MNESMFILLLEYSGYWYKYWVDDRKSSKDLLCGTWNPTAEMYLIMRDVPVRALHMTPDPM